MCSSCNKMWDRRWKRLCDGGRAVRSPYLQTSPSSLLRFPVGACITSLYYKRGFPQPGVNRARVPAGDRDALMVVCWGEYPVEGRQGTHSLTLHRRAMSYSREQTVHPSGGRGGPAGCTLRTPGLEAAPAEEQGELKSKGKQWEKPKLKSPTTTPGNQSPSEPSDGPLLCPRPHRPPRGLQCIRPDHPEDPPSHSPSSLHRPSMLLHTALCLFHRRGN